MTPLLAGLKIAHTPDKIRNLTHHCTFYTRNNYFDIILWVCLNNQEFLKMVLFLILASS